MQPHRFPTRRPFSTLVLVVLAAIPALAGTAAAAPAGHVARAIPYGPPGEGTLDIDLAPGQTGVRITGCRPGGAVIALFNSEPAAISLPGGVTVGIRPGGHCAYAVADRQGSAEIALPDPKSGVPICVQAFTTEPGSGSIAATSALRLEW